MNYTDINSKTIDQWIEEGWEWGIPISHEDYEKALAGEWNMLLKNMSTCSARTVSVSV